MYLVRNYLIDLKNKGNYSWSELSNLSGLPDATIRKIFSGETADPRLETVVKLVTAMGGSMDKLVDCKKKDDIDTDSIAIIKEVYEARIEDIKASLSGHIVSLSKDKKHLKISVIILSIILLFFLVCDLIIGSIGWIRF